MVKLWFLRWLIAWFSVFGGLVGVITLGYWHPAWVLTIAKHYARARWLYSLDHQGG